VFGLIDNLYQAKTESIWYHGTQKFIVIACYEYNSSAAFGMSQYSAYYVGVALFPTPFVLLYLPGINNIPY
jgi:hypothetical protein